MKQTIYLWTAGIEGTRTLKSELLFNKALATYEHMEIVWPGERCIANLRELIEHW